MAGVDITSNVSWSQDDDYYYAAVEVRAADGQVGTIEVKVDRDWVIRAAQMLKRRLMTTAPAGVDVGAWRNPSDPERFVKLCQFVAGKEVKRQLTEQVQRDGIVIAPWFGEWTTATADAAYRLILAAKNDDEASIQQLERIRECAEAGDPAAAKALGMINSVAKLVARGLPPPSVIATRMPSVGAVPVRKRTVAAKPPTRRRVIAPPSRTPVTRTAAVQPTGTPAAPTGIRALPTGMRTVTAPLQARALMANLPRAATLPPVLTRPAYVPPVQPYPYNYPYGYPYGMMPPPGGGGGGGGGGDDFPDEGESESDGFDDVDLDDGTYYEEAPMPEEAFPEQAPEYAIGEYPEEVAQSQSEEDDGPPEGDGPLPGEDGGPFPGEGSVGSG